VLHDCWKGGVLRETTNAMKEMVKGTRNGCVNLHQTSTLLDLIAQDQNSPLTQEMNYSQAGRWEDLLKS
jgi:hypothetical protein